MTARTIRVEPALLRKINERRLLEYLQMNGPASRAMLRRRSGLTAPTVSKAIDSLLERGLLEEVDPEQPALGRPGKLVRMATTSAIIVGVLIDVRRCTVVVAGMDGRIADGHTRRFATPESYAALLAAIETECRQVLSASPGTVHGVGVVVNALITTQEHRVASCANLHILDGHTPAHDLESRIDVPCRLLKATAALCLSERAAGAAVGCDDFALLDMTTGLGLGVISGGTLVKGRSGMAGEIGHVVVDPEGSPCGCGNRGCLETLATDAALLRLMSTRIGREIDAEEARRLLAQPGHGFAADVDTVARHVALAASMVVNVFNPARVVIHSDLFAEDEQRLAAIRTWLERLGLAAILADCTLKRSQTSKEQAAVSGIIHELTHAWAPSFRDG
ncbi:MAG: ROK family protein [Pirellulales bacterium]